MNNDKPKGKKRGGPPPTGLEARKNSGSVCTARRRDGTQCTNFAINGAKVCRMHGGSAPQVRAAAQVRILMASDTAVAKLVKLLSSKDERVVLAAAKDLADRANLAGVQNVEIGITKRDFSDVTADVVMDLDMGEDDDPNVVVAEIVPDDDEDEDEDDHERWEREDAQAERAQEIARMRRASPIPPDPDISHERVERERPRIRREPTHRVSMADPYADRYPERSGGRRSMSPKRWEKYRNEGGQG